MTEMREFEREVPGLYGASRRPQCNSQQDLDMSKMRKPYTPTASLSDKQ